MSVTIIYKYIRKMRCKLQSLPHMRIMILLNLVNFGLQTVQIEPEFRPTNVRLSRSAVPRILRLMPLSSLQVCFEP